MAHTLGMSSGRCWRAAANWNFCAPYRIFTSETLFFSAFLRGISKESRVVLAKRAPSTEKNQSEVYIRSLVVSTLRKIGLNWELVPGWGKSQTDAPHIRKITD
jgi:hypothetical protein